MPKAVAVKLPLQEILLPTKVHAAIRKLHEDQVLNTYLSQCMQANILMSQDSLPGVTLLMCTGHWAQGICLAAEQ